MKMQAYLGRNKVKVKDKNNGTMTIGARDILPNGYTRVKYIESSGRQYIDTGILATQIGLVKIDQQFTMLNARQEHGCTIFNVGQSTCIYVFRYNGQFIIQFGVGGDDVLFDFADLLRHEWSADLISNSCQIGQLKKENCEFVEWDNQTVYTFHLFARKANISGNISIQNYCFCKLFSSAFYTKTLTQIRDFAPALRTSDNTAGLYDTINNIFYTNAGTGTFGYETLGGTYIAPVSGT